MLPIDTGVMSTTTAARGSQSAIYLSFSTCGPNLQNVKIQFDADASAATGVRIANGAYSEGNNHGIASMPTAKKKLNRNSMTEATIPEALLPFETVPASTDIQQHMPMTANSMSLRRPSRSKIQIGGSDERK